MREIAISHPRVSTKSTADRTAQYGNYEMVKMTSERVCFRLYTIWSISILLYCDALCLAEKDLHPRIGIVGAGVGGTSSAYFLRQLFGDEVTIDVFEANKVGGRAATVDVGGIEYECGGVAIHKRNQYMVHFNEFFTKDKSYIPRGPRNFGIYGNDGMVFQGSDLPGVTTSKLFTRYGFDLFTVQNWIQNVIFPKFERIYTLQDEGMAFTTCENILRAMSEDFVNMTKYSLEQVLLDLGVSPLFIQELVFGIMRDNYGQTTETHGFVGAISLIGTDAALISVIGGNKNIPEFLLEESNVTLIQGAVTNVKLVEGTPPSYTLDYVRQDPDNPGQKEGKDYDIVIIATPINGTRRKIDFVDFPLPVADFRQNFHRTVTLFVKDGKINKTTFNLEEEDEFPPVIYTSSEDLFYDHIINQTSILPPNSYSPKAWETFLNHVPSQEEINALFETYESDPVLTDWLAYPEYQPKMDLPPFVLGERLYYVNAIESAASALEMSAIGARNAALLAFNQWYDNLDRIDV